MASRPTVRYCCIPDCASDSLSFKFFRFPGNPKLGNEWIRIISLRYPDLEIKTDIHGRCSKYICPLHFEDKYFEYGWRSRSAISIPTLFTASEISSGKPAQPIKLIVPGRTPGWKQLPGSGTLVKVTSNDGSSQTQSQQSVLLDHTYIQRKAIYLEIGQEEPQSAEDNNTATNTPEELNGDEIKPKRKIPAYLYKPRSQKSTKEDKDGGLSKQGTAAPIENDDIIEPQSTEVDEDAGLLELDTAETIDCDDIEESQESPEDVDETTFSWMKPVEVIDETEALVPPEPVPSINLEVDSYSQEQDEEMFPKDKDWSWGDKKGCIGEGESGAGHHGYQCNICGADISGFRYVCVQCVDFDLCAVCEAERKHDQHYVLRVPQPRPNSEVMAVLRTIRRALVMDAIVDVSANIAPDVVDVKEEPEDPFAQEHPEIDYCDIDNDYQISTEFNKKIAEEVNSSEMVPHVLEPTKESTRYRINQNDSELNTSIEDDYEMDYNNPEINTNVAETLDPLEDTSKPNTAKSKYSFSLSLQPTDSNLFEIVMDNDHTSETIDQEILTSAPETNTTSLPPLTSKQNIKKRKVLPYNKILPALTAKPRNIPPICYQNTTPLKKIIEVMPQSTEKHKNYSSELFLEEEYLDEYLDLKPKKSTATTNTRKPKLSVSGAFDKKFRPSKTQTEIKMATKEAHVLVERLRPEDINTTLERKRRRLTSHIHQ
ncbi:hypothetical protein O0L34_g16623 [Tuta absoluta]|nr:hypothetical protein O0L34_g16623 [Tuta absoluta]